MPESYVTQIKAESVRAQVDFIVPVDGGEDIAVMGRTSKTKWTEILLETGATMRVTNECFVSVRRTRPTAEEKAAQDLKAALVWIDGHERSAAGAVEQALANLATQSGGGYVDSRRMHEVLQAQAVQEIWSRVARISMNSYLRGEEMTKIEVIRYVLTKVQDELLDGSRYGSRSTSTWNNAVEDIALDVKQRFLRDAKWHLITAG